RGATASALLAHLEAHQRTLRSINRQVTDHGGVGPALLTIGDAIRAFSRYVNDLWNAVRPAIVASLESARNAVMSDIREHIMIADRAWRDQGNNGMSEEETLRVLRIYTWGGR